MNKKQHIQMTHMLQMKKWKTIRIKIIHINEKNHFYTFYTFFQLPRNKKPVFSKKNNSGFKPVSQN